MPRIANIISPPHFASKCPSRNRSGSRPAVLIMFLGSCMCCCGGGGSNYCSRFALVNYKVEVFVFFRGPRCLIVLFGLLYLLLRWRLQSPEPFFSGKLRSRNPNFSWPTVFYSALLALVIAAAAAAAITTAPFLK